MAENNPGISFDNTQIAFASKSDKELKKANFLFSVMNVGWLINLSKRLVPLAIQWKLPVRRIIRNTIYEQFCGGETLKQTAITADKLQHAGVGVILDYGMEAKESEQAFDHTRDEFIRLIDYASGQPNISHIAIKVTGFGRFALLEKIHAGETLTAPEKQGFEKLRSRVLDVCKAAAQKKVGIMMDAEESWIQQPVDDLCMEMMELFNQQEALIFNTYQLYRHDRLEFLQASFQAAGQKGFLLGAKLVRGAYMEKERKRAEEMKYTSPIQKDKETTDRDYNEAIRFCLQHIDKISVIVASHNEYSNLYTTQLMQELGIPFNHPHIHFSQLFGMSDHITFNMAGAGCKVSKYLPYGPVDDVIPYLLRRAQENSSVSGQTSRELSLIRKEIKRRGID
jgi:proline dehydrogenase